MYTRTSRHGDGYELKLVLRTLFVKKKVHIVAVKTHY